MELVAAIHQVHGGWTAEFSIIRTTEASGAEDHKRVNIAQCAYETQAFVEATGTDEVSGRTVTHQIAGCK